MAQLWGASGSRVIVPPPATLNARVMLMRKVLTWMVIAVSAVIPLWGADWPTHSGDNQRSAWQRDETRITKATVKNLQLLWKIKLDTKQRSAYSLFGPLILERAITDRG